MKVLIVLTLTLLSLALSGEARIVPKCEFINTIRSFGWPESEIPTWTCIVTHESNFDTDATNWSSGDHGIFQISQIYWCNAEGGPGGGCNKQCSDFHNDDYSDDAACARLIFDTTNGFLAWTTFNAYCNGDNSGYMDGC